MRADVQLMLSGCTQCWVFKFMDTLSCLGLVPRERWQPLPGRQLAVQHVLEIRVKESDVTDTLQRKWDAGIDQCLIEDLDPRAPACASDRIMVATYVAWVRSRSVLPPHLKCSRLSFRQMQCIIRFRLGWHSLAIQTGRFTGVPRDRRICVMCQAEHCVAEEECPVEDMLHFLLECEVLQPVRDKFPALFCPTWLPDSKAATHARYVLNHIDQYQVVFALHCMQEHRKACIESIQSGGGVGLLPERFVPEDIVLRRVLATYNYYEDIPEGELMVDWC